MNDVNIVNIASAVNTEKPENPGVRGFLALTIFMGDDMAHDPLVGWGWNPGAGRTPVPGTQEEFGSLSQAWADSGAQCPKCSRAVMDEAVTT